MTVGQMKDRLILLDDNLEVVVRCTWEGEMPILNVFVPRVLVKDFDFAASGTKEDFIAIECDQVEG